MCNQQFLTVFSLWRPECEQCEIFPKSGYGNSATCKRCILLPAIAFDCEGCAYLEQLWTNGSDKSVRCTRDNAISRVATPNSPNYPCGDKKTQLRPECTEGCSFFGYEDKFPIICSQCMTRDHVSFTCKGCKFLMEQASNGDDDGVYCFHGHSVASDNKPFYPCDKREAIV
jgi:hypothetical protein